MREPIGLGPRRAVVGVVIGAVIAFAIKLLPAWCQWTEFGYFGRIFLLPLIGIVAVVGLAMLAVGLVSGARGNPRPGLNALGVGLILGAALGLAIPIPNC